MKSNLALGGVIILIFLSLIYAGSVLIGSWTDLFEQQAIQPYAAGSLDAFPKGSITTEGFENMDQSARYQWTVDQIVERTGKQSLINDRAAGKRHYQDICKMCHGSDNALNAQGLADTTINQKGMAAPILPSLTANFSDAYLYLKIENGGTAMPRLGHIIIETERWQLINYMRTLEANSSK